MILLMLMRKLKILTTALIYYLKYLEEEPFSDSAWYNLGIIYNKLEMYEKAMEAYDYALAINSQNTFAFSIKEIFSVILKDMLKLFRFIMNILKMSLIVLRQ